MMIDAVAVAVGMVDIIIVIDGDGGRRLLRLSEGELYLR